MTRNDSLLPQDGDANIMYTAVNALTLPHSSDEIYRLVDLSCVGPFNQLLTYCKYSRITVT
jgi:hypothetical protein